MAGISALQQAAFMSCQPFKDQVNAIVRQQAEIKLLADPVNGAALAQVVRQPDTYGFPPTLLADEVWDVTYDAWANDPKSADFLILSGVQKWFDVMTGYHPGAPAP